MTTMQLLSVAPGLPTTDLARTIRFYERIGFVVSFNGGEFAILKREAVELHFAVKASHDPSRTASWIYVRVADIAALHEELKAAEVQILHGPRETEYETRELSAVDPDGNLLLFGADDEF